MRIRSMMLAAATVAVSAGGVTALISESAQAAAARTARGHGASAARTVRGHGASAAVLELASVKVAVGSTNKAHKLLVNAKGLPVYILTGDSPSHPKCASPSCTGAWPPVTTSSSKPALGRGISGKVRVWRHNHIKQVTLNGHPLYTYADDSRDAALGDGLKSFGGTWEVVTASGSGMIAKSGSGGSSGGGW